MRTPPEYEAIKLSLAMKEAGFPYCYRDEDTGLLTHCRSCIKQYQFQQEFNQRTVGKKKKSHRRLYHPKG